MSKINRFEDLRIWQEAREMCVIIHRLSSQDKFIHDYALKDQIRRASGSVMDNIAEGFGRDGNKEFKHFLSISKGSVYEVKSQLYRAKDFNYITDKEFNAVYLKCDLLVAGISKLIFILKILEIKDLSFENICS